MVAGILATEFGYLLVLVFVGPYGRHAISKLIRGYSLAFSLPTGSVSSRAAELVSWKVPDVDWWKLNVDGSVLATSGVAVSFLLSCQKLVESDSMEAIVQFQVHA
ncbi:hypothetical protein Peur_071170 [Populus x canadensis]